MIETIIPAFKPWPVASPHTTYIEPSLIKSYIETEQPNTTINLSERIKPYDNEKENYILVTIDANNFSASDYRVIEQLSDIITDSGELGEFELENLNIEIFNLKIYEKELI